MKYFMPFASVLTLLSLFGGQKGDTFTRDFAFDMRGFPSGQDIAKHVMNDGPVNLSSGNWHTSFQMIQNGSGDVAWVLYDVTVKAAVQPRVLPSEEYYRLLMQVGSLSCMGTMTASVGKDGKMHDVKSVPSEKELERRQEAGECPEFVVRVWRVKHFNP